MQKYIHMDVKFLWTEDMSVHHDLLDMQHQELFAKINALLGAIIDETAESVVEDMVHFFKDYMDHHFKFEERYLLEQKYPYVDQHKNKHDVFIDKYYELKEKIDQDFDKTRMVLEIENFMGSWLTQHIMMEDQIYARYFIHKKHIKET